jgi:hypothetical protein
MFESITIRPRFHDGQTLDLGTLAEALVFYGKVQLVGDIRVFRQVLQAFGPDLFLEFIKRGHLDYLHELGGTGVMTQNQGTPAETMSISVWTMADDSFEKIARAEYTEVTGMAGKAGWWATRARGMIKVDSAHTQGLRQLAANDISNSAFLNEALYTVIDHLAPKYPISKTRFEIERLDEQRFRLHHNLNLDLLDICYKEQAGETDSKMDVQSLLSHLTDANVSLWRAADTGSELLSTPLSFKIAALRLDAAIGFADPNLASIKTFQESTYSAGLSIADAIRSGERTFNDLLLLLAEASRFKKWLRDSSDFDSNIVEEFIRALEKDTWVERTPSKIIRWFLFTALGIKIPAITIPLSLLDGLMIGALAKGWKPNQFVNGPLRDFRKPD